MARGGQHSNFFQTWKKRLWQSSDRRNNPNPENMAADFNPVYAGIEKKVYCKFQFIVESFRRDSVRPINLNDETSLR